MRCTSLLFAQGRFDPKARPSQDDACSHSSSTGRRLQGVLPARRVRPSSIALDAADAFYFAEELVSTTPPTTTILLATSATSSRTTIRCDTSRSGSPSRTSTHRRSSSASRITRRAGWRSVDSSEKAIPNTPGEPPSLFSSTVVANPLAQVPRRPLERNPLDALARRADRCESRRFARVAAGGDVRQGTGDYGRHRGRVGRPLASSCRLVSLEPDFGGCGARFSLSLVRGGGEG